MGPIYKRLPNVPGAGYQVSADQIGLGLAAAAGVGVAAHAILRGIQPKESKGHEGQKPKDLKKE
jgi:hydrogenase small subunit